MAHNNGSQFEILLQEIYSVLVSNEQFTQVERNVQLPGLDGPRQIDVLITSQVAGMPLKTVVECRDHNRILDVTAIDAFQSKLVDVSANKGVLVSRKGFSGTAKKKAKRVGITLCTAADARNILSTFAESSVRITGISWFKVERMLRASAAVHSVMATRLAFFFAVPENPFRETSTPLFAETSTSFD